MTATRPELVDAAKQLIESLDRPQPERAPEEDRFLAAVDYSTLPDLGIALYSTGSTGAQLLASKRFSAEASPAVMASLHDRHVRVGGTFGGERFVWVADEQGCCVWSKSALLASGTGLELTVANGNVHTSKVIRVISFVADDYVHRGVELELTGGRHVIVADEQNRAAQLDPTYSRTDLLMSDVGWVTFLGRDLSSWLHVPHDDRV